MQIQFTTTISQKGQIVISRPIREALGIKPSDSLRVRLEKNQIVVEPALTINQLFGTFKPKQKLTKQTIKKTVKDGIARKYQ